MRFATHWALLTMLVSAPVFAAEHGIGLGDDCPKRCFGPAALTIRAGDNVTFFPYDSNDFTGPRNVVADDGSFRCARGCDGKGGNGEPAEPPWQFTLTFRSPGTVGIHDELSEARATITVLPAEGPPAAYPRVIEYLRGFPFGPHPPHVQSYFLTIDSDEIAMLDVGGEWVRTGASFDAWPTAGDGALPVCRFLDKAHGAHFYSHHAAECAALRADPRWIEEGTAFYLKLPDADGLCGSDARPLFRLYNNGKTLRGYLPPPPVLILHRYTVLPIEFEQMRQGRSWIFEGDARTHAFGCVPANASLTP